MNLDQASEIFAGKGVRGLVQAANAECAQVEAKVLAAVADELERTREERDTLRDRLEDKAATEFDTLAASWRGQHYEIGPDGKPRELTIEVLLKDRDEARQLATKLSDLREQRDEARQLATKLSDLREQRDEARENMRWAKYLSRSERNLRITRMDELACEVRRVCDALIKACL